MKRGLFIGIDDYAGRPLSGCVADATAMSVLLRGNEDGTPNYEVRLVTSDDAQVERAGLRSLLGELFDDSRDMDLLFFFAGHGAESPWGAELVTQDYEANSLGVSMNDIVTLANASPAREVVIILDCCFSGDVGNVSFAQSGAVAPGFRMGQALLREGVTILTAARSTQTAAEGSGHGAFTRLLLEGLNGAAADQLGNVTALSLYDFVTRAFGAWQQRPVFKSHLVQSSILRKCKPPIDGELLRKLPHVFARAEEVKLMSPKHEGVRPIPKDVEPTPEQKEFDYFKSLRNAGLLTTAGDKDLYFVALDSEGVFLTPLGRYFWRLASERKL